MISIFKQCNTFYDNMKSRKMQAKTERIKFSRFRALCKNPIFWGSRLNRSCRDTQVERGRYDWDDKTRQRAEDHQRTKNSKVPSQFHCIVLKVLEDFRNLLRNRSVAQEFSFFFFLAYYYIARTYFTRAMLLLHLFTPKTTFFLLEIVKG